MYTAHLACCWKCQRRPLCIVPNFHAERSSPQTAVDLNISNYTILNTFKWHARRIWLLTAHPDALKPLSVVNSTLTKIQCKTWTRFPTSNTSKTSQAWRLNHHHLCHGRKYPAAPALRRSITLLNDGNGTLRVALRRTPKRIRTTHLRRVKSTNISSVWWRKRAWRRTITMCWKKSAPLCGSEASKTRMASRSWWLGCQMISISGSGNYTLLRIWDGMTITNALSNTGVETSSKPCDGWCCNPPTLSISLSPLNVALTEIRPQHRSKPQSTLRIGGGRHR